MKIRMFYERSRCESYATYNNLLFEKSRYSILKQAMEKFASLLKDGLAAEDILNQLYIYLKEEYKVLTSAFAGEVALYAEDDIKKFRRLLVRILQHKVVEVNVVTSYQVPETLSDGSNVLEGFVHLVLMDAKQQYHAMILHGGTCHRSMKGKSIHTSAVTDLESMIAKLYLEKTYPNIVIHSVYLTHKNDLPGKTIKDMEISGTASSNMHSIDYHSYYDDFGVLDEELLRNSIAQAMEPQESSCYGCQFRSICKVNTLSDLEEPAAVPETTSGYRLPSYTQEQRKVVCHKDGPMLVCAGPGSGKTAAIIGRIQHLVNECGIAPQVILVVTFTNKAAKELKERCLSFLEEDNMPTIATLHAFAYRILKDNQESLGRELNLLTKGKQLEVIKNITSVLPALTGFSCEMKYGDNGLYKTLLRKLDQFFSMSEYEFFQKNPKVGNDFIQFAGYYKDILECGDYISFDEQISLANTLFETHPNILKIYQQLYPYVMVDEYQDVNEEQVKLLYHVAAHGNIVVVGDDDQNIYGFRGASSDYMFAFPTHYPNAQTVVLKDNFRSTKELVNAAQSLIHNNNKRIEKDIRSGSDVDGVKPTVLRTLNTASMQALIDSLVKQGYRYDDIAILSFKNSSLEGLHTNLTAPSILAKSYLRDDGLFLFAHSVLKLYQNIHNDVAFFHYISLFGKQHYLVRKSGVSLYEAVLYEYGYRDVCCEDTQYADDEILSVELRKLQDLFFLLHSSKDVKTFLSMCAFHIGWNGSDSLEVLFEQLDKQGIRDMEGLVGFMDCIVDFEDELRVEVNAAGKITLITCHDAKGKEFPVVILFNDFSAKDEEARRLFYVAITRPKDQLFIFQDPACVADFLSEIPHVERGCA